MNAQFVLRQIGYVLCALVAFAIAIQLFGRFDTHIINSIQLQLASEKTVKSYQPGDGQPKLAATANHLIAETQTTVKKVPHSPKPTELSFCVWEHSPITSERVCGKQFSSDWLPYLEKFGLTDEQTSKIPKEDDIETMKLTPKFVTAFSDNHYQFAKRTLLAGFAKHLPNEKLIVYNLGLKPEYIAELESNPQVAEIRKMKFSKYPDHVKNLYGYHWKPLLIAEFLQEHNAIFYMDAHISWNTGDIQGLFQKIRCNVEAPNACDHYPLSLLWNTGHSIFATTKSEVYKYFPVNISAMKSIEMGCAGYQLTFGTSDVRKNIFKWVVLCALEKNCMAPSGVGLACTWGQNQFDYYAKCHRYDQSIFNILLANRHDFNRSQYFIPFNLEPPKKKSKTPGVVV